MAACESVRNTTAAPSCDFYISIGTETAVISIMATYLLAGWIAPVATNERKAYCKICRCTLVAHYRRLVLHASSKKHLEAVANEKNCSETRPITSIPQFRLSSSKMKELELRLASFVAEHTSLRSVDHLSELLSKSVSDSALLKDLKVSYI